MSNLPLVPFQPAPSVVTPHGMLANFEAREGMNERATRQRGDRLQARRELFGFTPARGREARTARQRTETRQQRQQQRTTTRTAAPTAHNSRMSRRYQGYRPSPYSAGAKERAEARKFINVFNNPFSNASLTPRIPDGKSITSQGIKFQIRKPVTVNVASTDFKIFLVPNACNPCFTSQKTIGNPAIDYFVNDKVLNYATSVVADDRTMTQPLATGVAKWRVVSYGLHVSHLNNTDSNDGWWEAVRLTTSVDPQNYFAAIPSNGNTGPAVLIPDENKLDTSEAVITNLPSYTTGRLRDLHNVIFSLHPDGCEHDFKHSPSTIELKATDASTTVPYSLATNTANLVPHDITSSTGTSKEFVDSHVDEGYDTIMLKIHGRAAASPTQLLVHVVQNIEIIYEDRAINAQFHTRTPTHSGFSKISKTKAKKTHAAELVKAT